MSNDRTSQTIGGDSAAPAAARDLADLLGRVVHKDKAAFSALYRATSAKLYGIVLRILHRRDLADEVLQEVYVKIWDRAGDFNPRVGAPITWMATIARNRALDEARRKVPQSIEDHPELFDVPTSDPSALLQAMRSQDGERLTDCLSRLEPDKREMVVLAYCEGLSREELAVKYGHPVNTVKTWIRRSLAALKGCLDG